MFPIVSCVINTPLWLFLCRDGGSPLFTLGCCVAFDEVSGVQGAGQVATRATPSLSARR